MKAKVGAVILAAGSARRMGRQKLLLPLAGVPLLAHVLKTVQEMPWAACLAVIGQPQAELSRLCRNYQIPAVFNAARETGQASSVKLAVETLPEPLDGILFFPGDQPLVSKVLIEAIVSQFEQADNDKAIIVPGYQGRRYSPVLFGSHWRSHFAGLKGDTGGRQIIKSWPEWVKELDWPDPSPFYDADTWEDYLRLKQLLAT
ncbi:NTP transferase domain-containing protein [Sporomusa aerivorans]|uniref:nucleotidyltransferase family protein n=1 Tax=Sporomusa aerivorans TaxID=204936 RepID=UPI00352B6298